MCLRSAAAEEAFRHLSDLEQSLPLCATSTIINKTTTTTTQTTTITATQTTTITSTPSMQTTTTTSSPPSQLTSNKKQSTQNRFISRSVHNLHLLTPKNRILNNGHTLCRSNENNNQTISNGNLFNGAAKEEEEEEGNSSFQTNPILGRQIRQNVEKFTVQNQETNIKMPYIRMKKWLSSADVKYSRGGRRNSRDHLMKNSKVGTSTTNLSYCKSINKHGPTSNSNISQHSLLPFRLELREPSFIREKGVLQVFVNGKPVYLPVPNSVSNLDLTRELDAPTCEPKLNWVYGYRGKDCRGNLYELPTGEIAYFTGTIVVLHNPNESLQRYYTKHTSDIKCMAIHPNKLHIATGQTSRRFLEKGGFNIRRSPISSIMELNNVLETDRYKAHVHIWDSITLQTLRTIGTGDASANFDRGVQCCAFSHAAANGMQLASANDQVFACEFHPYSKNILMSYGKGHCNVWSIDGGALIKKPIIFEGRNKPKLVLCSHFTERGHIITGDSNGTLTIWDTYQIKPIRQVPKAHNGGVWALCLLGNGHFISAGKDRMLFEWETDGLTKIRGPITFPDEGSGCIRTIASTSSSKLFIGTTRNTIWSGTLDNGFQQIQQAHADAVTHITSHPTKPYFLSSSTDNKLRLYDTETKTILWTLNVKDEICCTDFHPKGDTFVIGFANGTWTVYIYTHQTQIYSFEEEINNAITTIRFSTIGNFLAVATKGKKLTIYAISGDFRHYVKVSQITELNASIKTMDWSTDATLLRANDNDLQHYIWNSSTGQLATIQEAKDVEWASARCVVSFENACISYALMKSIAAIDCSPDKRYIAVALSNGMLRFYQYPTTTILASYKEAHSCSVSARNVSFVGDLLISDGSNDGAIYQWKLS
uniref:BMA-ELP-1 n=1 Tax=Brugia malayi TaxID=6279 RepID=A0A0H5SIH3_BRUMA|nr:BMA-ELP-1 [Brugia malayi]